MLALAKGDEYGADIFSLGGGGLPPLPNVYSTLSVAEKRKWNVATRKLVGVVGDTISNTVLHTTWTEEFDRIQTHGAGPPDERPFAFALCMAAVDRECTQDNETTRSTARSQFRIQLQSYDPSQGFKDYADKVRRAERDLTRYGVIMSDSEKRQEFYQWFNPNADEWNVKKSVWKETVAITFDQLLTKGLNYQQELDLRKATADASGVKAFVATTPSSSASNKGDFRSMTQPTGQQIAEFVARTVGRGRSGRFWWTWS